MLTPLLLERGTMLDDELLEKIKLARQKYGRVDFSIHISGEFLIVTISIRDFTMTLVDVFSAETIELRTEQLYKQLLDIVEKTAVPKPVIRLVKPVEESSVACESCGKLISGYQSGTVYVPAEKVMEISQERFASNYCADCYVEAANSRKRKV